MKISRTIATAAAAVLSATCLSAQSLIPVPESLTLGEGTYSFGESCRISAPKSASATAEIFAEYLDLVREFPVTEKGKADVTLKLDDTADAESYRLTVDGKGVLITGDEAGLFYGMRTLQQLMDQYGTEIPYMAIKDKPRYHWRGLMLDCGRYFYPVEFIKKYLDRMSCYKMNTFHWHLSEDAGWRIEIKSHPELTSTAAWRNSTQKSRDLANQDRIPHGGYYTQRQIRDIVEYAADRHINIVPEVDLPGHTKCILAAHPELNCTGEKVQVPVQWKIWPDVLCIGNEGTLALIKDILSELIDMFPGEYINIGGDEAPQAHWETCEKCKALMEKEHIETPRGLQSWLTARMDEFVRSKGRKILGWDEILEGGELSKEAAVMSWRGTKGGITAARAGHKVVMAPNQYMYIDYYQSDDTANEPFNIGGCLPLEKVYSFDPFLPELTEEESHNVLGVQANLWCEYVHSPDMAWYMTFPRALACAEIGWSPRESKDYEAFRSRAKQVLKAMDRDQIPYRIPEPEGLYEAEADGAEAVVNLKLPVDGATIYYTVDGSDPQANGIPYTGKVRTSVKDGKPSFACVVILPSGRYSAPYFAKFKKQ